MNDTILVLHKKVGEKAQLVTMENTLENFQKLVGGYVEQIKLKDGLILLVNEEARLKENPRYNFHVGVTPIFEDAVFCLKKGSSWGSITEKAYIKLIETLKVVNDEPGVPLEGFNPDSLKSLFLLSYVFLKDNLPHLTDNDLKQWIETTQVEAEKLGVPVEQFNEWVEEGKKIYVNEE